MALPVSACAATIAQDVAEYLRDSVRLAKDGRILKALSPLRTFELALNIVYIAIQGVIIMMFKPVCFFLLLVVWNCADAFCDYGDTE